NLYFNIFDYFQYEKFIQIHVGGIILYIKKPLNKGFLTCLKRKCPIICPRNNFQTFDKYYFCIN
ncbi:hypothetical protein CGS55_15740, partial [Faecalibacterium prausnitzii]